MVESEIGFVVGNMLSMGSLRGKIRAHVPNQDLFKRSAGDRRRYPIAGGSGLISDDATRAMVTVVRSPDDSSTLEAFPLDAIVVRTNLEQKSEEMAPPSNVGGWR